MKTDLYVMAVIAAVLAAVMGLAGCSAAPATATTPAPTVTVTATPIPLPTADPCRAAAEKLHALLTEVNASTIDPMVLDMLNGRVSDPDWYFGVREGQVYAFDAINSGPFRECVEAGK